MDADTVIDIEKIEGNRWDWIWRHYEIQLAHLDRRQASIERERQELLKDRERVEALYRDLEAKDGNNPSREPGATATAGGGLAPPVSVRATDDPRGSAEVRR